jgi:hypothetical protein
MMGRFLFRKVAFSPFLFRKHVTLCGFTPCGWRKGGGGCG